MKDNYIKKKAATAFVNVFGGSIEILAPSDVYCRVFDKDGTPVAYLDVIVLNQPMNGSYPLKVTAKSLQKLTDKRLNPTLLWSFIDGLIYCKIKNLSGEIYFGKISKDSPDELIVKITERQKYLRFI